MCIRIYIFNFKKQVKKKNTKEAKENISGKSIKKNNFATARVKIFLVTRISGNKMGFLV